MSRLSADATSFGKHSFRQGFLRKVEDDQYITRTIETLKTRRRNFAASLALSLSLSLSLDVPLQVQAVPRRGRFVRFGRGRRRRNCRRDVLAQFRDLCWHHGV